MKRILLAIAAGVLCFGIGLVGTYFALPEIAPEAIEQAAPADSASAAPEPADTSASTKRHADAEAPDSIKARPSGDPTAALDAMNETLRDSIQTLRDSMDTLAAQSHTLEADVQEMEERVEQLQAKRTKAADLAQTLTRLEDEELRAVLGELEMETYAILYEEASGRNRTRILQSLPPDKAAQLVNQMIVSED